MASASAPGKLILFGEHAVVFGQPALATAVDLRAEVFLRPHTEWLADGQSLDAPRYAYVRAALRLAKVTEPHWIEVRSMLPEGSGLGSSAAVTVASLAAARKPQGIDRSSLARDAFEVELDVQGRASPIDTTTATAGGAILVLPEEEDGLLWTIAREGRRWSLHRRTLPDFRLVVGFTGISAPTGPLVARVRDRVDADPLAHTHIEEIGAIARKGLAAVQAEDWGTAGALMDRNHALLNALGVGHPRLEALVLAARKTAYGAKLTGAGGGGSMIALTDEPESTARAIAAAGGRPFVVRPDPTGVEVF